MNPNESIETPKTNTTPNETAEPAPQEVYPAAPAAEDDDMATAEEMEAFIRDRKAKKEQQKKSDEDERDIFGEYSAPEKSIDPYLEPDPSLPWPQYRPSAFLSRGCRQCPKSYVPVSESEMAVCSKVTACDWLHGIRQPSEVPFDIVEVRFKNNRKDFFRIPDGISVGIGDVVAVEGTPGHDVGIVSLVGEVCRLQMKKHKVNPDDANIKKLFRRAKVNDIERWAQAVAEEGPALFKTRRIAADLGLEMKINDVEYQGDNAKAIFYYTADDRVDFRDLIKLLADAFKVRVEMKQIGVRQEAGKVGGLGTCGRELCCSTWLTNFKSVTTNAAKTQQILPNPQKLAGQCGKLKCCLNFEYEVYADALKAFPPAGTAIRFKKGLALYKKTDVLRGIMWYAYEGENDLYAIPAERVKQVIEMNQRQEYPERLEDFQVQLMSTGALEQETANLEMERELSRMADSQAGDNEGERRGDTRDGKRRNERERRPASNEHKNNNGAQGRQRGNEQRRGQGGKPPRPPREGQNNRNTHGPRDGK
ncbi:MAG: putative PSP1-like protein [bacterium P3]|nr:MAG: putative PSP1-like protein [bacterium P3]KWW40031.1 MAG: putative PSP1-like protein [bacterium F083]